MTPEQQQLHTCPPPPIPFKTRALCSPYRNGSVVVHSKAHDAVCSLSQLCSSLTHQGGASGAGGVPAGRHRGPRPTRNRGSRPTQPRGTSTHEGRSSSGGGQGQRWGRGWRGRRGGGKGRDGRRVRLPHISLPGKTCQGGAQHRHLGVTRVRCMWHGWGRCSSCSRSRCRGSSRSSSGHRAWWRSTCRSKGQRRSRSSPRQRRRRTRRHGRLRCRRADRSRQGCSTAIARGASVACSLCCIGRWGGRGQHAGPGWVWALAPGPVHGGGPWATGARNSRRHLSRLHGGGRCVPTLSRSGRGGSAAAASVCCG